jgi:HPt (histidine-containing phosphotransfer) domain-containing protein
MGNTDSSTSAASEPTPLDLPLDQVLERLDGDRGLLATLADLQRQESCVAIAEIRRLVEVDDASGLRQIAHRLAGSLMVFGASDAVRIARTIEHLATAGQTAAARLHLAALTMELQRVNAALDRALQA